MQAAKKVRDPSKPKRPGKIMQLSGPMQDFFGAPQGTRTDVAAKVRAYIKEKDLQDPKGEREGKRRECSILTLF